MDNTIISIKRNDAVLQRKIERNTQIISGQPHHYRKQACPNTDKNIDSIDRRCIKSLELIVRRAKKVHTKQSGKENWKAQLSG
jgi:hypothetical protein